MGEHIDYRGQKKKKNKEHDASTRHNRVSFKTYLRELDEALLAEELEDTLYPYEPEDDMPQDE